MSPDAVTEVLSAGDAGCAGNMATLLYDWDPLYFALVMATGIVSIAAFLLGFEWIGRTLFAANFGRSPLTGPSGRDRCEGVAQGGKVRQPREAEVFEDAGHFAEEVDRLPIGFPEFDPERVEREHYPVGEPATPSRGGGFVGIRDNFFSFCDRFSGEEADFQCH